VCIANDNRIFWKKLPVYLGYFLVEFHRCYFATRPELAVSADACI
jgi:hypothetical protein